MENRYYSKNIIFDVDNDVFLIVFKKIDSHNLEMKNDEKFHRLSYAHGYVLQKKYYLHLNI